MSIQIERKEKNIFFNLNTDSSTYQMMVDEFGVLLHLYYGKKLAENDTQEDLLFFTDMGFSGNPECAGSDRTYSLDTLPLEVSGFGVGDFRDSMVTILHEDGSRAADFRFLDFEIKEGSYVLDGMPALYDTEKSQAKTLEIRMKEIATDIVLTLCYSVFENGNIITRAARVVNNSNQKIILERCLSMNIDMMYAEYDMIYFAGRHCMERVPERIPIKRGKVEIGSTRGTSSHQYNPSMILCEKDTTEDYGNCYGFCLAYSGSFVAAAQRDQKGQTRVQMGIQSQGFAYQLMSGEEFVTPQVIISFSAQGFATLSHQYHDILRENMCRGLYKYKKRPVLINNWEATYMDFDEKKLLEIAETSSELGLEMLVLDDGWFGKRNDDNCALGDWFVNEEKIGGSLKKLGDTISCMGMKFGLWFEPEMISEDSDLYRAHSDWALTIPGRAPNRARNQLVLDMSRQDVRDYLFEKMEYVISNAPIAYVKWDMNRSICDLYSYVLGKEHSGELYHRYILGVYELLERLLTRFPELLLEGCSGGGGRFDAGMLYYSPQIWCSDNTDAINRMTIQYGTSFFYPISSFGSHVSACPNHQTGRSVSLDTRGAVALAGSFGYELDLNKISEEEKEVVKEQIVQFHECYELTHEGDYYRLTQPDMSDYEAWAFVAKDKTQAMLTLVKTKAEGNPLPTHTKIKGLDQTKKYECTINNTKITKSGASFLFGGITIPKVMTQYESIHVFLKETE